VTMNRLGVAVGNAAREIERMRDRSSRKPALAPLRKGRGA